VKAAGIMAKLENPVLMGVIGAAHGIRGEVRVKSFTQDPLALADYGALSTQDGRTFTIADIRPAKTVVVARFKEVRDRDAAEALAGTELFVERALLPQDLDEDEFYYADLIGLEIRDLEGAAIGKVAAVHDFGAGDIIEMRRTSGGSVMIPFTRTAVPTVALKDGHIVVDPQAAGLLGDDEPEEGEDEGDDDGEGRRP
jgi:16S rRNA processing protein RimM